MFASKGAFLLCKTTPLFLFFLEKMPTYKEDQKPFYSTRSQVLVKFSEEQEKKCFCYIDTWAGNENQITCINCIRKENLKKELDKKCFWPDLKHLKYWKVRRQGQYKILKISPVYPVTVTTMPAGHLFPEGSF